MPAHHTPTIAIPMPAGLFFSIGALTKSAAVNDMALLMRSDQAQWEKYAARLKDRTDQREM